MTFFHIDMKKILTLSLLLALAMPAIADLNGNGYYRVQNYKTKRYASVIDNRGSIDFVATQADLQAIRLWLPFDDVCHDAAAIFDITKVSGEEYQMTAQGTGIYQIIEHYLRIRENGTADGQKLYMAYGVQGKATRYLADANSWSGNKGAMSTNGNGDYRKWFIWPVDANSSQFFGVQPTVDTNQGLYASLYASFPFSANSSGLKCYYASKVSDSEIEMTEIVGEVPAATPVVVQCPGAQATDNRVNVGGSAKSISGNKLTGQYFNCDISGHINRVAYDAATMRVIGKCKDGSIGFIKATGLSYIPANTAYLIVPTSYPDEIKCKFVEGSAGIEDIEVSTGSKQRSVYTLTGILLHENASDSDISSLPKGFYIIGGKKVKI